MLKKTLLLILAIFSTTHFATTYTVSSASEISSVMLSAQPGDTLIMVQGIWKDQRIKFRGNGTADNPIVLKAEVGGHVYLTGESYLRIGGEYLVVDGLHFTQGYSPSGAVIEFRDGSSRPASNCRLTNTAIVSYNPSSINKDYKWVSIYGSNNRVDHCYFENKNHSGTTLVVWMDNEPDYHLIDSNYFAARPDLGFNGGETIRIGTSDWSMLDSRCIVEYNLFEKCDGETEIISNKSGHNIYRYNTFLESKGTLTLRHGNDCDVYSNFFFGNNISSTGGIRIIGENHKVFNNYLENLEGDGYRAAISIVRGVENSPLNRYFQVKNAQIINNTIVNCDQGFAVGYGSSSDQTLPPEDIQIVNNVIYSASENIRYYSTPINPFYSQNIFSGSVNLSPIPDGIILQDPQLELAEDTLFRPISTSPLINNGNTSYTFVTDDFDGQSRQTIDIGADEFSTDPILRRPVFAENVGPKWFPLPEIPPTIVYVNAGQDSLLNAVKRVEQGTIIKLITDGGLYTNSDRIIIDKNLYILASDSLNVKPKVVNNKANDNERAIFEIRNSGDLELTGVDLDGLSGTSTPAKYLITTAENSFNYRYKLLVNNCLLHDVVNGDEGSFFRAAPGTKARQISFSNSTFYNAGSQGIKLDEEAVGSSNYNSDYVTIDNSTFFNIPNEAIKIYAGDNIPFTPGTKLIINHSTFYNCGTSGSKTILSEEADSTIIKNSIFENCSSGADAISIYGIGSILEYSTLYNSGNYLVQRGASLGKRIVDYNPMFVDTQNADFTLSSESPILLRGTSKTAMGDLRWATNSPTKYPLDVEVIGEGQIQLSPETEYNMFDLASQVVLTATASEGFEFIGFGGDVNSNNNPLSVIMFGAFEITATFDLISSISNNNIVPMDYKLHQNYPNPFNPVSNIQIDLPHSDNVSLIVYDMLGQKIKQLASSRYSAGSHSFEFDGEKLPSGVYLLSMKAGKYHSVIKMNLMR